MTFSGDGCSAPVLTMGRAYFRHLLPAVLANSALLNFSLALSHSTNFKCTCCLMGFHLGIALIYKKVLFFSLTARMHCLSEICRDVWPHFTFIFAWWLDVQFSPRTLWNTLVCGGNFNWGSVEYKPFPNLILSLNPILAIVPILYRVRQLADVAFVCTSTFIGIHMILDLRSWHVRSFFSYDIKFSKFLRF